MLSAQTAPAPSLPSPLSPIDVFACRCHGHCIKGEIRGGHTITFCQKLHSRLVIKPYPCVQQPFHIMLRNSASTSLLVANMVERHQCVDHPGHKGPCKVSKHFKWNNESCKILVPILVIWHISVSSLRNSPNEFARGHTTSKVYFYKL